jgi:PleD family two-component response regulator
MNLKALIVESSGFKRSRANNLTIAASIGAAVFSVGDDFDSLFAKADKAVYEAKDSGQNKVIFYQDKFDDVI